MHAASVAPDDEFSLTIKRSISLCGVERRWAYGLIAVLSALIASGFAAAGAWLILPFAGLELAGLFFAFRYFAKHEGDYESLTITGDHLVVERCMMGRMDRFECNRYWAQVVLSDTAGSCRLALRSQGQEIEFGTYLSEGARRNAARELRNQLRIRR
jgi:uncharacterized membrane protein